MKIDSTQLRRYAPYLAPFVIVALGWALLVRPISDDNARAADELDALRQRLTSVRSLIGASLPPPEPLGDPMQAFERQVAGSDPTGRLLEELSRLATATGLEVDTIEMAQESAAAFVGGPTVSGSATPDPRFALFEAPLKYSPVTLTGEADYQSLGEFLWRLRDLATLIEIRSLDIAAPVAPTAETARPPGRLRVTLTLFSYARAATNAAEASE